MADNKKFYITTAIDYTNAAPHIGHAYEKVMADGLARFWRQMGREVFFLTGADQHGQKVAKSAAELGMKAEDFAIEKTALFKDLWQKLAISNDGWAETRLPEHHHAVRAALQKLFDEGELYLQKHHGFYSVREEQFLTDKHRDENGNFPPQWGEVIEIEEENWYFRLAKHRDWLEDFLQKTPNIITPDFRLQDVLNALENIDDLCISRPRARLEWGIPLPFAEDWTTYVWFDALMNYASFAGYMADDEAGKKLFAELWPPDLQIIGKDILAPPHAIYWLIMLHALGFADDNLPKFLVHGWWNFAGEKMSKSLGNIVSPLDLLDKIPADSLRYYLLRDIQSGYDANFSAERLISICNSELANNFGNLLSRLLAMLNKFCAGKPSSDFSAVDEFFLPQLTALYADYQKDMAEYKFDAALGKILEHGDACNKFLEQKQPWVRGKNPAEIPAIQAELTALLAQSAHIFYLLVPIMPNSAKKALHLLGLADFAEQKIPDVVENLREFCSPIFASSSKLDKPQTPLFARLEK